MTTPLIRGIDTTDDAEMHAVWAAAKAADEVARPWTFFPPWPVARANWTTPTAEYRRVRLAAFDGDAVLGMAVLTYPLLDNLHLGYVDVCVPPEHRRRRIGSGLLDQVVEQVRKDGRTTVLAEVNRPLGVRDWPGEAFAVHHRFAPALTDGIKIVDLVATQDRWEELAAEAAPHHTAYEIVTWTDVVPDHLVEGYCRINATFNSQAPAGDLLLEDEVWDEARVREKERFMRAASRHEVSTAAIAPDGWMAGVTEIGINDFSSHRGFQSGTIVAPEHRGHRLGLATKLRNQQEVRRQFPDCQRLMTGNADTNVHMNAVNEVLGYETVEDCIEMQIGLADV